MNVRHRVMKIWNDFRDRRFFFRELNRFSAVFVCSELEAVDVPIQGMVYVAPNTVEVPQGEADSEFSSAGKRRLLFVGNLDYPPNQDGLRFLVHEIWPEIHRCYPDATFMIVGRRPRKEREEGLRRLLKRPEFEVRTDVSDVSPYYRQATVCLAPIRFGGGTRVKIIEAFAHGRPVVSTTVGCEGLDVVPGEHLLVEDNPRSFAEQCVRLLRDAALGRRLSRAGRDFWSRNHTPAAFDRIVITALRRLGVPDQGVCPGADSGRV